MSLESKYERFEHGQTRLIFKGKKKKKISSEYLWKNFAMFDVALSLVRRRVRLVSQLPWKREL